MKTVWTGWRLVAAAGMVTAAACFPGADLGLDFDQGELAQHKNCDELRSSLQARALSEAEAVSYLAITGGTVSRPGFTASEPGDTSPTNNQERGVDEADFFKYDGGAVYALHGGNLVIADESGVLSSTPLPGAYEMHVDGARALVMAHSSRAAVKEHFAAAPERDADLPVVLATLFDISDRTAPTVVRELLFEGEVLGTRRVGDDIYLVTKALLGGPQEAAEPSGDEHWLATRKRAVESAGIDTWMPSFYDKTQNKVERCSCSDAYLSGAAKGDDAVTVYGLSLSGGSADKVETTTIFGDGAQLYASTKSLVVALPAEETVGESFQGETSESGPAQVTWLHRFALNKGEARYRASGRVKGWILNQFSLSEHEGYLRVATMTGTKGASDAASHVYVLDQRSKDKELFTAGGEQASFLKEVGRLTDIGVGEDLYAARFQGDVGYLVTFRETDPLWTIDLSDPENPELLGELMVPGYSTYLHPIEGGHLLAVGRGGRGDNGVKLSLFDVRDLTRPSAVEEEVVGGDGATSDALGDHRAFNWMESHRRLAIPFRNGAVDGLNIYKVTTNDGFRFQGRVDHADMSTSGRPSIRRSLTAGDKLWALSSAGITVTDVNTVETLVAIDLTDGALPQ